MPIIYLKHPVHAVKIATLEAEAEADERNGWTRYNPDTPAEISVEMAPVEEAPVKRKYTRRVNQQTIEQPNEVPTFLTSASDESEGN